VKETLLNTISEGTGVLIVSGDKLWLSLHRSHVYGPCRATPIIMKPVRYGRAALGSP